LNRGQIPARQAKMAISGSPQGAADADHSGGYVIGAGDPMPCPASRSGRAVADREETVHRYSNDCRIPPHLGYKNLRVRDHPCYNQA
jgi:hypothetical protein